jgi:hypothetical protein
VNRRTFLGLIPGALAIPNEELRQAASAFAKACEAKPEIQKKVALDCCFTGNIGFVQFSDGSYELLSRGEIERRFGESFARS